MHAIKGFLIGIALAMGASAGAHAQETCYEGRPVPAIWSCAGNDSNSADFTSDCRFIDAHVEQVVVACPAPPGGWAGAYWSDMQSVDTLRRLSCDDAGFGPPAAIDGQICKSDATPNGGAYVYTYKYTSGNSQDKAHQLMFCYPSKAAAPSASGNVPGDTRNRVSAYACAGK
jgi:hypothetical protein